jgi:predicted 3-demethylubiquinone-9 3-methyltransferase (glyoxalase superfamily)
MTEQKITLCLWFDFNAEEAVDHYLSIFPKSSVISTTRYGDFAPERNGAVMTISFEIDGQRLLALNGGPQFKFTPALSLIVNCDDQAEIDALWGRNLRKAARTSNAVGSPTNSACPGKSSRARCPSSCPAVTPSRPIASCGR